LAIERDGIEISLEPRMMELLVALAEHAGDVIGAEQLLIEVWRGRFYGDNPVHRAIGVLRRQLGDDTRNPVFIEMSRKCGYRTKVFGLMTGASEMVDLNWRGCQRVRIGDTRFRLMASFKKALGDWRFFCGCWFRRGGVVCDFLED
jgi:Transcriptional regulatory protein, C terminal